MLPFLHHKLQLLLALLERSSAVLEKYSRLDLDLAPAVTELLDAAVTDYRTLGQTSAENELLALKAQFVAAENGTHPISLERATTHRRELMRTAALLVLQQSAQKLRSDAQEVTCRLDEGRAQLATLALVALQKGMVPADEVSPEQAEVIWRRLLGDPEVQLAARQVAMQLNALDIELLLLDLFAVAQPRA